ncbi:uncharacterized protein FMAN_01747 [Fusarium mangiferae]|uniref:T6SS Phospholipase effector Tle1-like catalytic domain-containing protein n=1 Tax=Fusarium mangiferae TaxID=192010 RepID=A0A1L7SGL2_FUSMA|nr:uncharacterized protein FMAN_01747 [Fusarium mangiferae]CVK84820.1 uncharacterized protein FMAN_01747 [Fusarium mangiferae]
MTKRSQKRKEARSVPGLIFVAFDGTWHGSSKSSKETVVSCLPRLIAKGENARKIRLNGVGSDGLTDKFLGGLGGWGTLRNVIRAYDNIAEDYNERDRIILCGYSRGAWAARYLALIIERIGLVRDGDRAFYKRLYKACDNDPYLAKVDKYEVRGTYKFYDDVKIDALCCFDTVGSLGLPLFGIAKPLSYLHRNKYQPKTIDPVPKSEYHEYPGSIDLDFRLRHELILESDSDLHMRTQRAPSLFSRRSWYIGKIEKHEGLVHAPLAWMVQQLKSHMSISFDEDKLRERFPSYISEEQAKVASRQGRQHTTRKFMEQHAWCCPSGSLPGAGIGKLFIMGKKDRDPGMVLKFCNSEYPESSTDELSRHEAASSHPEIHINARGRQACGFIDAVPGYIGSVSPDSSRVWLWKRNMNGGQDGTSANIIHEARVGFLEARLLGLPLKEASELSCCDLERSREDLTNDGVSDIDGKAQRRQSTRIRVKKWFKRGFGASSETS